MAGIPGTWIELFHVEIRGEDIAAAREAAGLTQEQVADACGWSQSRQSRLERPGRVVIEDWTYRRLTIALSSPSSGRAPSE